MIKSDFTSKYLRIKKLDRSPLPWISFGRHSGKTKSLTSETYANKANARRATESMTGIMILRLQELGYRVVPPPRKGHAWVKNVISINPDSKFKSKLRIMAGNKVLRNKIDFKRIGSNIVFKKAILPPL